MQKSLITISSFIALGIIFFSAFGFNSLSQSSNPTDTQRLEKIENLIARGKIIAPSDTVFGLVPSIKNNKLPNTTIDLILLLANQFDSIDLASIYRPYTGGWPAHSNGEAIDLSSVTYNGKQYPQLDAVHGDNQVATGVWVYVANILKQSKSVISVITALDLADKFSAIPGFIRQDITGTIDNISVLTSPNGGSVTERHEDHLHIEVSPSQEVLTKITTTFPKINGQGSSPDINPIVSPAPSAPNQNQYTSNTECKNTLGRNYVFGMSGDLVRQLQNCLTVLGLFSYPAGSTGYFGNVTTASYKQWLSREDICPVLKQSSWFYGETSPRVKALQRCLDQVKLFDYASYTGFYGPITTSGYNRWMKS